MTFSYGFGIVGRRFESFRPTATDLIIVGVSSAVEFIRLLALTGVICFSFFLLLLTVSWLKGVY